MSKVLQPHKAQGKPHKDYIKACHDIGSEPYKMRLLAQAIMSLKQQANQQVKCFSCGKRRHVQKNCKTNKNTPNKSLVGCSPWGRQESGMTERLHFHFSL